MNNTKEKLHKAIMIEMMTECALIAARSYEKYQDQKYKDYVDCFSEQLKYYKNVSPLSLT
jgi:predicted nucleic acid-binding protein